MSRRVRWIAVAGAVLIAILLLRATLFQSQPLGVEVAVVERRTVEETVTNSQAATVRSRLRARVGTRIVGRVESVPRREGSVVERGQVLLRLDGETARRELQLAREEVAVAEAELRSARASAVLAGQELRRARSLRASELISEETLEEVVSRADGSTALESAAQAALGRAAASFRLAEQRLDDHKIRAPFDGVVAELLVEAGESVIPGQPLIELLVPDSLYVSAELDEIDIGRVSSGLRARVRFDPYPDANVPGRVVRVAPYVSDALEQNRTLEIEVDFRHGPGDPRPRPGTSADVEVILDSKDNALSVPTFAIVEGDHVLVVDKGRARRRDIETGLRNWDYTEILSGLEEGEIVITSLDRVRLKPGVRVRAEKRGQSDE